MSDAPGFSMGGLAASHNRSWTNELARRVAAKCAAHGESWQAVGLPASGCLEAYTVYVGKLFARSRPHVGAAPGVGRRGEGGVGRC
jgi:hypothetical protein